MDPFKDLLAFFGIARSHGKQGEPIWTIQIVTDEAGDQTRSAHFDEELGKWKFDKLVNDQPLALESTTSSLSKWGSPPSHLQDTHWTSTLHPSSHTDFFRNLDWAASALGPCHTWPHSLRLYTHMLFSDSRAAAIYWGPARVAIYNEHLPPLIGDLHPVLMSRSFEEAAPTLWNFLGPLFHDIERDHGGVSQTGLDLPVMRDGYLEETWWDGSLVSLKDDQGAHGGVYFSWVEVTRMTLRDRRTSVINRLGQSSLVTSHQVWQHIHEVFTDYPRDVPMAILYSADGNEPRAGRLRLEHTIGVGSAYTAAPKEIDFISVDRDAAIAPLIRRALNSPTDFLVIDLTKEEIHPSILEHVQWQGFGEQSRHLIIMPLRAGKVLKGCLILGLNPRRGFDPDHRQFVADLARQLRELVVRVTTNVEAQERERHLMTELSDTEQRISKIIDVVPVGIYEMAADGKLKWANKHYFEILGVPPDERETSSFDWAKWVLPEDEWQASEHLESVGMEAVERSGSMRLKRFYTPPNLGQDAPVEEEPSWIFYSASPDHRADGSVRSVMGSLLDVSHLKWSELQHIRNAKAAREDKEKQEEFIDITSHEMRNPLSAITHCAESVVMSLQEAKDNQNIESLVDIIKLNAEAAESILFCAAHQRRIVDEVLTLGKLDSGLLTVSPAPFHLPDLLDQMIQVFKIEFAVNNIELQTVVDEVLATSSNSTVYSDSSRLMQILTNLLTNAIKFTRTQDIKEITIRCGWSSCVPSSNLFGDAFEWSPSGKVRTDSQHGPDHEQGDIVYLYFAIVDSGRGISDLFKDKVFSKFEQADRRTHTQYGGSGLGLYISRELVEMQGGRIGLDTTDGVGSTFAFYTKARRSAVEYESSIDTVDSAQPTTETLQASTPPQLESNPSPATLPAQTNYNILLVEDNLLNQKILVKQLRKSGCTVHAANNGGEAIDTLLQLHSQPPEFGNAPLQDPPQLPFDCILMDWEMPICDGLRATTRIRALETQTGSARNLIIGVTANAREEQIRFAIEAGMDTVVPKPFRVRELFERIKALVALRRLQDLTLECAE